MAKFYQVGGYVRDKMMGLKSKDRDYAVETDSFSSMRQAILDRGGEIYLETPEFFTIRANVPKLGPADFVLCRKEGVYSDGRHPDSVEVGTIFDDLARRDFTMNAMALQEDGTLLDPHSGQDDIRRKVIRCVGSTMDRFSEDSLRMIRAIRFSITKGMLMDESITSCFNNQKMVNLLENISPERIREELIRCFRHNTAQTLQLLGRYEYLMAALFDDKTGIWLKPTMEDK